MNVYLDLFVTFAKIGGLTFGGGYAMLPILERETVEKHNWATNEELMDYYAIGQCTPGIIAVNVATFIGKKLAGIPGSILATLGILFPSFVIISLIAGVLNAVAGNPVVSHAFAGIRVCVCVLIFNSVLKLWKNAVKDRPALVIFLTVFLCAVFFDISPILFVVLTAAAGIIIRQLEEKNHD